MLVNSIESLAEAKNLESTVRLICPTVTIEELPSIHYIRKARGIIRIISKSAAVYELAKNPIWVQTHWDRTSR